MIYNSVINNINSCIRRYHHMRCWCSKSDLIIKNIKILLQGFIRFFFLKGNRLLRKFFYYSNFRVSTFIKFKFDGYCCIIFWKVQSSITWAAHNNNNELLDILHIGSLTKNYFDFFTIKKWLYRVLLDKFFFIMKTYLLIKLLI